MTAGVFQRTEVTGEIVSAKVYNLTIGLVSPPMGGCLLIVSTVTGLNYWALARAVIPFVIVEILVLGILVFVPEITLFLPRAMGLWN